MTFHKELLSGFQFREASLVVWNQVCSTTGYQEEKTGINIKIEFAIKLLLATMNPLLYI